MKRIRRFGSWALGGAIIATMVAAGAGIASADTTGASTPATSDNSSSSVGSGAGGSSPMGSDVLGQTVETPSVIDFSDTYPTIGQRVSYSASGLVPKQTYRVLWETFQGTWDVDGNTFIGESYTPAVTVLGTVTADANGEVHSVLQIPTGYGDIHQIGLADASGIVVAQGSVTIKPSVSVSRTQEPEGNFFTLRVQGIGYGAYSSAYEVLYDNHLMGNIAAVTTNGTAVFQVRAEGIGPHLIEIAPCSIGSPYLNEQQSPYSWKPTFSIPVTVTKGHPGDVQDPIPAPSISTGNHLTASPGHGVVGSTFTLTGQGLPANESLTIEWSNTVGNHVTAAGYHAAETVLGHVTSSAACTFATKIQVPVNVGGRHTPCRQSMQPEMSSVQRRIKFTQTSCLHRRRSKKGRCSRFICKAGARTPMTTAIACFTTTVRLGTPAASTPMAICKSKFAQRVHQVFMTSISIQRFSKVIRRYPISTFYPC
ncbi:hypothetical protein [Alicyclobacillus sacchari]|uniref:hypothetical protein n=1 Tax=Alicyclobacillus sacchari TaxID=392010 RepID=UPI0024E071A9|nr:hypothetical protein [Alicyclobacillus sacchari]